MKLPRRRFLHLVASAARCRPCRGSRGRKAIPRGQCLLYGQGNALLTIRGTSAAPCSPSSAGCLSKYSRMSEIHCMDVT